MVLGEHTVIRPPAAPKRRTATSSVSKRIQSRPAALSFVLGQHIEACFHCAVQVVVGSDCPRRGSNRIFNRLPERRSLNTLAHESNGATALTKGSNVTSLLSMSDIALRHEQGVEATPDRIATSLVRTRSKGRLSSRPGLTPRRQKPRGSSRVLAEDLVEPSGFEPPMRSG
jgi:hypothetical protein